MNQLNNIKTTNLTAEEMLETESDIKALLEKRSNLSGAINTSVKLIDFMMKHLDIKSLDNENKIIFISLMSENYKNMEKLL